MSAVETVITDLEGRNQTSIERLTAGYLAALARESFTVVDVLKLELKGAIEGAEVAALWIPDTANLEMKLTLAEQCGDGARLYRRIEERLATLDPTPHDPREGGYSKVFAFLRSLQTPEERAGAGQLTHKAMVIARAGVLAVWCEERGDVETARLFREAIIPENQRHQQTGRRALAISATNEESQARARRAAYRTLELVAETHDPTSLRRLIGKSRLPKPAT